MFGLAMSLHVWNERKKQYWAVTGGYFIKSVSAPSHYTRTEQPLFAECLLERKCARLGNAS
jgi:hypothetical protein